jgi:hypothetical protein
MKITLESNIIKVKEENKAYDVNYGNLKKGSDTKVDVVFEGVEYLKNKTSCGCTEPTITILEEGFLITINYDSNKVGTINQYVDITTTENQKVRFNLKGQIL